MKNILIFIHVSMTISKQDQKYRLDTLDLSEFQFYCLQAADVDYDTEKKIAQWI